LASPLRCRSIQTNDVAPDHHDLSQGSGEINTYTLATLNSSASFTTPGPTKDVYANNWTNNVQWATRHARHPDWRRKHCVLPHLTLVQIFYSKVTAKAA